MATDARAEARTTLALAGAAKAPVAAGLTFVEPAALAAVSRKQDAAEALGEVCRSLELDFAFVRSDAPDAPAICEAVRDAGSAAMWAVPGPLGRVLEARGWAEGLRMVATQPDALRDDLDEAMASALDESDRAVAAGASVLVIAEDLASTSGPLVPPDFAFDEVFPRLTRIVDAARDADLPCVLHSDGDVRVFLAAARRAGFSAVHAGGGLSWEAFEAVLDKARPLGLVAVGGLLTSDLARGVPSAIVSGSRAGVLARGGGLLLADDGGLTTPEEMSAFVSALTAARSAVAERAEP